jgi:hypothetical protein|tara:strand:- start:206 stop:391 length:186 start_codon:yes stop_codon:yes gene_type:complete
MGTKVNETVKKKSKDEIMKDNQIILDLYEQKIEENMKLRRENKKLKEENDNLKKLKEITKT